MFKSIRLARERDGEGFTLLELMIGVVVLAIILAVAIPVYVDNKNDAKLAALKTSLTLVTSSISACIGTDSPTTPCVASGFSASGFAPWDQASGIAGPNAKIVSQAGTVAVPQGTVVFRTGDNFCTSNGVWAKLSSKNLGRTTDTCTSATVLTPTEVPAVPTNVTVILTGNDAVVSFETNGGTSFTVTATSNNGSLTVVGTGSPITIPNLPSLTSYTFTVVATNNIGNSGTSSASSPVIVNTVPLVPVIGTATNVGLNRTYNNGAATVAFTSSDGTSFTATSSPGGFTATGTSSPLTVTGLQSSISYTFTVVAVNTNGNSTSTSASNSITATTVPQAPTIGTSTPVNANNSAEVTFTNNLTGGSAITSNVVTSTPGGLTATGSSPVSVLGLSNGPSYTFTVRAINANGSSASSAASNTITLMIAPAAITNLTSTGAASSVTMNWTTAASTIVAPVTNIEVLKDGVLVATLAPTATSYIYTGLSSGTFPGTVYIFTARTVNAAGTASMSITEQLYTATGTNNYTCNGSGTYNGTGTAVGSCGTYQSLTTAAYYDQVWNPATGYWTDVAATGYWTSVAATGYWTTPAAYYVSQGYWTTPAPYYQSSGYWATTASTTTTTLVSAEYTVATWNPEWWFCYEDRAQTICGLQPGYWTYVTYPAVYSTTTTPGTTYWVDTSSWVYPAAYWTDTSYWVYPAAYWTQTAAAYSYWTQTAAAYSYWTQTAAGYYSNGTYHPAVYATNYYPAATLSGVTYTCPSGGALSSSECRIGV